MNPSDREWTRLLCVLLSAHCRQVQSLSQRYATSTPKCHPTSNITSGDLEACAANHSHLITALPLRNRSRWQCDEAGDHKLCTRGGRQWTQVDDCWPTSAQCRL